MPNEQIARLLYELADLSDYVGESQFKARAYRQAGRYLESLQTPIETIAEGGLPALEATPHIGKAIAEKIVQYLQTGTIRKHQELLQQVPAGILEVMSIPGIGPKTARQLAEQLGVHDVDSLHRALGSGAVEGLLGTKKAERLRLTVDLLKKSRIRRPIGRVLPRARELLRQIEQLPSVERALLGGSIRRMQETVGDLDYLVATIDPETALNTFTQLPMVKVVFARGENRAQVFLEDGLQVDLKTVPPASWGAGALYITGSKAHSIRLRERALARGLKLNEYGIWQGSERVASESEEAVYSALGLQWIPPPMREDTGELSLAEQGAIPNLVQLAQVRGDLQTHTHWSDGDNSIEEMWNTARTLGYEYLAPTDHAEMFALRGDPLTVFRQRQREIDTLNERTGGRPYLLNGLEVNIASDGSLEAPEDLLREAEIVLAGVHHTHGQPPELMTQRLLRALEHPRVHILAHPTGRRFGKREPNSANWSAIFQRARELGKAIEINGYITRMDPPTPLVHLLRESGALVSFGTDSHRTGDLWTMELAVGLAQRGWLTPERVLNTRLLAELKAWLKQSG